MNKWVGIVVALILVLIIGFFSLNTFIYNEKQGDSKTMTNTENMNTSDSFQITPISHATFVLKMNGQTIVNDPVGGVDVFSEYGEPNILLISDIHGDHMDVETVQALATERTAIIMPQAVANELPESIPGNKVILANGEMTSQGGITITAIPMYNIPEGEDAFHTKGRGNGYVLEAGDERIYIAGDTGPIPEMKALQNIDVAFIPMNLPYTMSVEDAADAVLAFKPRIVHPYHYRGPDGLADVNVFKERVNKGDPSIQVELLNFYPEE